MIYTEMTIVLVARFWKNSGVNLKATVHETLPDNDPPEVVVLVQEQCKKNPMRIKLLVTEILISQDLTKKANQALARNNLREAIRETYGKGADDMTLQQLADLSRKLFDPDVAGVSARNGPATEPEDAAASREDATTTRIDAAKTHEPAAEPADAMTIDDAPPKVTTEEGRSSKRQAESDADSSNDHHDQEPPEVPPRRGKRKRKKPEAHAKPSTSAAAKAYRKPFGLCAKHGLQTVITAITTYIGLNTLGEHFHDVAEKKRHFEMRNDTEGAGLVAYYASVQVCAMAKGLGYTPAFISPEPKNQKQA
jgi:hypothetical protein